MSEELKLVIFDCDGTLVDSQAMIIEAMQRAFLANCISVPDRHSIRSIIGLSLGDAVERLAGGRIPVSTDVMCNAYKAAYLKLREEDEAREPLYSGARKFLEYLNERDDVLLGVATGKSRRGVDVLFEREELHGLFTTIQTADTSPSKPDPHMIERAMAETGARRAHTYMIGDTSFDIEMAVNARVAALGVSWGYHTTGELNQAGAHGVADKFSDLEDMMPGIFRKEAEST